MRRLAAVLGTALFLILAPGTIAGLIPWWISGWRFETPFAGWTAFRVVGGLLMAAGGAVLLDSFARFALQGLGTPAPVFPTQSLVVTGLYRYVRNPMYVAVLSLVFGQSLLFGDVNLLEYALALWLGFHLFVIAYEEPTLRRNYGAEYERYCANVSRWIPGTRAWSGG